MKVQWFSGQPPAVGWWPASLTGSFDSYRWWDGRLWSWAAFSESFTEEAYSASRFHSSKQALIQWRHWSIEIDGTDGRGAHL